MTQFNDNFLRACRMEPVDHTPVWFMRQAGRYQPEYREIRKKFSLIEICKHPDVCTEVTLKPIEQLNADAAILFSDITLPLGPMGIPFDIVENVGPVIHEPIKTADDINRVKPFDANETLPFVGETIRQLHAALKVPLIGFVGAPFTLASYMIEGGPSKAFYKTKIFMYSQPKAWHELMDKLAVSMADYLRFQKENGCQALQVFDSWVGNLSIEDYREYVYPHMQKMFSMLKDLNVPLIHFGVVTGHLLEMMKDCGATVVGLDWRVNVSEAWKLLKHEVAIQGNLDPAAIIAPWNIIEEKSKFILDQIDRPGFIFNLGHGIMPQADVATMRRIVDYVHQFPVTYK
ncbi:MAG: uroporphyrinogen decarboxylase [Sphingobacteriales bacterium]|nr:MAG: uroporphyrinogen decarboxylase [Sphingobacteriales bacterium]